MSYKVTVTREGKWWMVHIPEVDGLTQARRLGEAGLMAREYLALALDRSIDDIDVEVNVRSIGKVTDIGERLEQIARERAQARQLERDASRMAEELARELVNERVPLRDVGIVLGVSHQRVHQLVNG